MVGPCCVESCCEFDRIDPFAAQAVTYEYGTKLGILYTVSNPLRLKCGVGSNGPVSLGAVQICQVSTSVAPFQLSRNGQSLHVLSQHVLILTYDI